MLMMPCCCPDCEPGAETKEQAHEKSRKCYDDGVPLFTKKAIQNLGDQLLAKPAVSSVVTVTDMFGNEAEFRIRTGEVTEHYQYFQSDERLETVLYVSTLTRIQQRSLFH